MTSSHNSGTPRHRPGLREAIRMFLHDRFSLDEDKDEEAEVIQSITRSIEFRGANLWALILAVLVASIGLNVNSTAVIIGAMLISPLMGPIMGIGLGVGINDLDLIKRAGKNFIIAVIFSLITSTIYFFISPLHVAQSELLARTSPTIWDTAIAFVGGLAGIIASTRREKFSNVIPGVAIATALMPPLCTAGYGIANGNLYYFAGAFYLFMINSVCISLATLLIVRFLRYHQREYASASIENRVRNTIWVAVLVVVVPSTYLAYELVRKSIFEQNAKNFVDHETNFEYRQVAGFRTNFNRKSPSIQLSIIGEPLPPDSINELKARMPKYGLENTKLVIRQGNMHDDTVDVEAIRSTVSQEVIQYSQKALYQKDIIIDSLTRELSHSSHLPIASLTQELSSIMPDLSRFSASRTIMINANTNRPDTVLLAYAQFKRPHGLADRQRIKAWLSTRTNSKNVVLLMDR